jgi:hypothetical protein
MNTPGLLHGGSMICPRSCCGAEFEPIRPTQIYCTSRCANRAAEVRRRKKRGVTPSNQRAKTRRKQRNANYVYADKIANGCSRCPEHRPSCLDYHHVLPALKIRAISDFVRCGLSFKKLKAEIKKCILLCANCHRVEELGDGYTQEDKKEFANPSFKILRCLDKRPEARTVGDAVFQSAVM